VTLFRDMLGKPKGTPPARMAEIIDGALDELDTRGVWQGADQGPDGQACTVTALCATGANMFEISDIEITLVDHLGLQDFRTSGNGDFCDLRPAAHWNDFLASGPDEIKTVLAEVRDKLRTHETVDMSGGSEV
jgi:hypothetical protein